MINKRENRKINGGAEPLGSGFNGEIRTHRDFFAKSN